MKYIFLLIITFNLLANEKAENKGRLTNEIVIESIKNNNKNLPMQLDEYSRAEKVTLEGNDIYYYFTLVQWSKTQLDTEQFKTLQLPSLIQDNCGNESRAFLDDGRKLVFVYHDKNNELFSKIMVKKSDCDLLKN